MVYRAVRVHSPAFVCKKVQSFWPVFTYFQDVSIIIDGVFIVTEIT